MIAHTAHSQAFPADAIVAPPHLEGLLRRCAPSAVTLYDAGSVVYAQGDKAGPLYLVSFGAVRLCRLTADGRRQISGFVLPGEVFGFEAGGEHHFYAECTASTGLRALRPSPGDATESTLGLALETLTRTQEHLLVLGRQTALERMAAFLTDIAARQGHDRIVALPMQRNDIADYLGLTFETVSRVIGRLKSRRLIRLRSTREIELLDPEALAALSE